MKQRKPSSSSHHQQHQPRQRQVPPPPPSATASQQQHQQHLRRPRLNVPAIHAECRSLLTAGRYESCEILALFALSSQEAEAASATTTTSGSSSHDHLLEMAATLEILGDCCSSPPTNPQFIRAVGFYRRAATQRHLHSTSTLEIGSDIRQQRQHPPPYNAALSPGEGLLRLKEARCLLYGDRPSEALGVLRTTLSKSSPENVADGTHALYGDACVLCGRIGGVGGGGMDGSRENDATRAYLDAVRRDPYQLDCVSALFGLGCNQEDVVGAVREGLQRKMRDCSVGGDGGGDGATDAVAVEQQQHPLIPLQDVVSALLAEKNQNAAALSRFLSLDAQFPNNVYVLERIALLQINAMDYAGSERTFARIRQVDPNRTDCMAQYAELLYRRGANLELNRLAGEMLELDDRNPVAWVCLALYHLSRRNSDRALMCAERAITLDASYAFAHRVRGVIYLSSTADTPEEAVASFRRANDLERDYANYEGLVEGYLADEQYKEALCAAKEYLSYRPRDGRALTLVGVALSHAPSTSREGREKAKRAFRKALAADPDSSRPLFALADLYAREEDHRACVDLLSAAVEGSNSRVEERDLLHTKLADAYALSEEYADALTHYHTAISMNEDNMEAKRGLERLEKLMRGLDPNASENDDHDDDDDGYEEEDMEEATNFEVDAGARGYL